MDRPRIDTGSGRRDSAAGSVLRYLRCRSTNPCGSGPPRARSPRRRMLEAAVSAKSQSGRPGAVDDAPHPPRPLEIVSLGAAWEVDGDAVGGFCPSGRRRAASRSDPSVEHAGPVPQPARAHPPLRSGRVRGAHGGRPPRPAAQDQDRGEAGDEYASTSRPPSRRSSAAPTTFEASRGWGPRGRSGCWASAWVAASPCWRSRSDRFQAGVIYHQSLPPQCRIFKSKF